MDGWINRNAAFYNYWTTKKLESVCFIYSRTIAWCLPLGPEIIRQCWLPSLSRFFIQHETEKLVSSLLPWLSDGKWAKDQDPKLEHSLVDNLESTHEVLLNQWESVVPPKFWHKCWVCGEYIVSLLRYASFVWLSLWKLAHIWRHLFFSFFGLFEKILIKIKPVKAKWL